jgi:hypothetical protein
MDTCILCQHDLLEHGRDGCHRQARLSGGCGCTFAQLAPVSPAADAPAYRERSDWWDGQARAAAALAKGARLDLPRWHALTRFERSARRAELEHRLAAESLLQRRPAGRPPGIEPAGGREPAAPQLAEHAGKATVSAA